jgi:hypothetical protein
MQAAFLGPLLTILLFTSLQFPIRSIFYLAIIPGLLAFCMILLVQEHPIAVRATSKMRDRAAKFNVEKIKPQDLAGAAGPPDEET